MMTFRRELLLPVSSLSVGSGAGVGVSGSPFLRRNLVLGSGAGSGAGVGSGVGAGAGLGVGFGLAWGFCVMVSARYWRTSATLCGRILRLGFISHTMRSLSLVLTVLGRYWMMASLTSSSMSEGDGGVCSVSRLNSVAPSA